MNRNILIAVDTSENSRRAILYLAGLLGGMKGSKASVLHVIREPEEDEFPAEGEKEKWYQAYRQQVDQMLEEYRRTLIEAGFPAEDASTRSTLRYCPSMEKGILAERDSL